MSAAIARLRASAKPEAKKPKAPRAVSVGTMRGQVFVMEQRMGALQRTANAVLSQLRTRMDMAETAIIDNRADVRRSLADVCRRIAVLESAEKDIRICIVNIVARVEALERRP